MIKKLGIAQPSKAAILPPNDDKDFINPI
jgi:hypothetical protein